MNLARYRFVLSRPLQLLPVLFGISLITFVLVRSIPGDPARALARLAQHAGCVAEDPRPVRPRPAAVAAIFLLPEEPAQGRPRPIAVVQGRRA